MPVAEEKVEKVLKQISYVSWVGGVLNIKWKTSSRWNKWPYELFGWGG